MLTTTLWIMYRGCCDSSSSDSVKQLLHSCSMADKMLCRHGVDFLSFLFKFRIESKRTIHIYRYSGNKLLPTELWLIENPQSKNLRKKIRLSQRQSCCLTDMWSLENTALEQKSGLSNKVWGQTEKNTDSSDWLLSSNISDNRLEDREEL